MIHVSIITPTWNSADFILNALRTCVSEEGASITHIICDNNSSDGLRQTLYSHGQPNATIVSSEKDTGPAQAINRGFRLAEGSIIGWLNSDDAYAPGAIDRALKIFADNPNIKMVYGQAMHMDLFGANISSYPSMPPNTGIEAFKNNCFVCQPTIFFRPELLEEVGFLDESLKTAFDFDWVIRIFKHYKSNQIGFIEEIQAYSRLHGQCLTKKFRETVISESIQVIAKHFGFAPSHWLQTYYEELCATLPSQEMGESTKQTILDFFAKCESFIEPVQYQDLISRFSADIRSHWLSGPLFVNTAPDGWVKSQALVLANASPAGPSQLSILCNGNWPIDVTLTIQIISWDGLVNSFDISSQEDFLLEFEVPRLAVQSQFSWLIRCDQAFIPAVQDSRSNDTRELSFKVLELRY